MLITSLKRAIKTLVRTALSHQMRPAHGNSPILVAAAKEEFHRLAVAPTDGVAPSEAEWRGNMNTLRHHVLSHDIRYFLTWPVIERTMFLWRASYSRLELRYLQQMPDWNMRWRAALVESQSGAPFPCLIFPSSSANLIHHAYHIRQFEEKTSIAVAKYNIIYEFGGGYGSMRRLFHNLGFKGKYIISDLPAFSSLQRYYLGTLGIPVAPANEMSPTEQYSTYCVSSLGSARLLMGEMRMTGRLFMATWSLSESPIALREALLPIVAGFDAVLIGYQKQFGEIANIEYFNTSFKTTFPDFIWSEHEISHLPDNYYLFGTKMSWR